MESDFKVVPKDAMKKNLDSMISSTFSSGESLLNLRGEQLSNDDDMSDADEEELEQLRRREVKKMFDLIDKDGSGYIDRKELETLLKSLNKTFTHDEVNEGFARVDVDLSGRIDFDEFYGWYKNENS
mmetsp:Transcript_18662/g.21564  ORF Transcript_18662/g.21564 Transcript_18662/m.21564 type:complete len:127 (-) Transcript_18662:190-570(-)